MVNISSFTCCMIHKFRLIDFTPKVTFYVTSEMIFTKKVLKCLETVFKFIHEPFPAAIDELGKDLFENKEAGRGNGGKVSQDVCHNGIMTFCWISFIRVTMR